MNWIWVDVQACLSLAGVDSDILDAIIEHIDKLKISLEASSNKPSGANKKQIIEALIGSSIPTDVTIHPPKQCKNKGSGKRIFSGKEKAIKENKRHERKCNACGRMGYHDSRNCPNKFKGDEGSEDL